MKLTIILCLFAVVFSAQAVSELYYLPVDPLPENAEEIALEYLENLMAQRYPGEDITIGEPMRLYLPDGKQNALDFPLAINIEGEVSFEREKEIHDNLNRARVDKIEYRDGLQDEVDLYSIRGDSKDETYNLLCEERNFWGGLEFRHTNIVLVFSKGEPIIVSTHNNYIMHHWDVKAIEKECGGRFLSYGVLPPSPTGIAYIRAVFTLGDGSLYWHCINEFEYDNLDTLDYDLGYPCTDDIRKKAYEWSFFHPGLLKSATTTNSSLD